MVLSNINQKTDRFQVNKNYPSEKIDPKNISLARNTSMEIKVKC